MSGSKNYAKLVWYLFGDTPDQCLVTAYSKKKTLPVYQPVPKLHALYDWLKHLGYKLSTAEETLVYGTDVVYQDEGSEEKSVVCHKRNDFQQCLLEVVFL